MAYVAARGGERAIAASEELHGRLSGPLSGELVRAIERQLPYLVDRVMGEGSLYAPELAALALAQTGGDLYEAVLLLRAYRSTQPRIAYAQPVRQGELRTVRRISAAFKDIPGGQILGPSLDYSHRLLKLGVLDGQNVELGMLNVELPSEQETSSADEHSAFNIQHSTLPAVADWQRAEGLLEPLPAGEPADPAGLPDVTREPISFPAPRAHRLQSLARADTGGVLALGYASMRGYGMSHPTVNELRLGYAELTLRHPVTGVAFSAGRVRVSQAEVVDTGAGKPGESPLRLGFTATIGWNEVKTIAGAMLDLEMSAPDPHPAHREEFVLYHTEPVESSGFCIHYKLPHYVTFGSALDNLRKAAGEGRREGETLPEATPSAGEAK
ncbi:carbon-phosphorus lyase complex subunit PhnI [Oscillochloris sp. ZM17-4]|uniref:carbon-phosphorus lyase complex subunit PhnI n=1 Tax=Oscillochloris sp. ZM17-4 TaxID=2866714 RepID=UPI001C72F6B8|nr:carbon-phosphorus lyase complex subunit PhnI [Oscillochloris sp. ZM17-4]MBX0329388.1 carbon-phosphorus lyase complex subunit PhnI [Oscillochloris sp. ZM17-4]